MALALSGVALLSNASRNATWSLLNFLCCSGDMSLGTANVTSSVTGLVVRVSVSEMEGERVE